MNSQRTRILWLAGTVAGVAGVAAMYAFAVDKDVAAAGGDQPHPPAATAEVVRETLADTRSYDGVVGHGAAITITAPEAGTVTGVAAQDTVLANGTELYRVDERPVTALVGAVPMYRDLGVGAKGADVEQLETAMAAFGYDGFDVDDEFTGATAIAVRSWQDDLGLESTGVVRRGDVVFVGSGDRVDAIHVDVGATLTPGAPVLDLTGSQHVVMAEVPVRDRNLVTVDDYVTVNLPGGVSATGTVTAADVVAAQPDGPGGPTEEVGVDDAVTNVEVTLDASVDTSFLGAPAEVVVVAAERPGVLTVPTSALLALSGGGHAVEVLGKDGTTEVVPVETGLHAGGRVEISGDRVEAGTVVRTAGR